MARRERKHQSERRIRPLTEPKRVKEPQKVPPHQEGVGDAARLTRSRRIRFGTTRQPPVLVDLDALSDDPLERTERDWAILAYIPFGTVTRYP